MRINILTGLPRAPWGKVWAVTLTALIVAAMTIEPPLWALTGLAVAAWATLFAVIRKERNPRYRRDT
jgi:hypothetical protein